MMIKFHLNCTDSMTVCGWVLVAQVEAIEDVVDLWVASIDEYDNAASADRVPQRLAELGPQHTMLYDNEIPDITEAAMRTRLFAWYAWGLL